MCGVFGFIKKNLNSSQFQTANELRLMRQMMIVGSLRGIDGTGMAVIDKNFSPCTLKIGDNPYSLIHDKAFGSAIGKPFEDAGRAFFGHNRYATKGEVSTDNAHPFMIDHITLVHNGTINYGLEVPKGKVDSMVLAQRLATDGIKVFSEIDGAWTCVWYNSIEKSINFLCNGERPLHIVENFNGIYWASEEKMLDWTLSSLNFNFMAPVKIPLDTVISYKLDQQLSRTETKVPTRNKYTYQSHYYIGNDDKITKDGYKNKSPKTESKSYIPKKQQSEVIVKFFRKLYNSSRSQKVDNEYEGTSDRNELIFCYSAKDIPLGTYFKTNIIGYTVVNKNGEAPASVRYQVRAKDLVAINMPKDQPDDEELVVLKNGFKIQKGRFRKQRAEQELCLKCADVLNENTPIINHSIIIDKTSLTMEVICPSCTDKMVNIHETVTYND